MPSPAPSSKTDPAVLSSEQAVLRDRLLELLAGVGRLAVAFSGGVDSAVVAQAAQIACTGRALAVTAVSPSLASGELEAAKELAAQIGIPHQVIWTDEFSNPDYLRNEGNRCYFCKSELYSKIELMAPALGVDVILNGANLDDQGDYRPGMQAAREHAVRSPLLELGFRKADVRALARFWGLPVWEKPASPCLSSRIAHGLEVTQERIQRVDAAEKWLRENLGLAEIRVRHEFHDLARIEVPVPALPRLLEDPIRGQLTQEFRKLGFKFVTVDLEGFRSGSLNSILPLGAWNP